MMIMMNSFLRNNLNKHLFFKHRLKKYSPLLLDLILTKNLKILCKRCLQVVSQSSILTRQNLIRNLRTSKIQRQNRCSFKKTRISSFLWTESTRCSTTQTNPRGGQRLRWPEVLSNGQALLKAKIRMLNLRTNQSIMIPR